MFSAYQGLNGFVSLTPVDSQTAISFATLGLIETSPVFITFSILRLTARVATHHLIHIAPRAYFCAYFFHI